MPNYLGLSKFNRELEFIRGVSGYGKTKGFCFLFVVLLPNSKRDLSLIIVKRVKGAPRREMVNGEDNSAHFELVKLDGSGSIFIFGVLPKGTSLLVFIPRILLDGVYVYVKVFA